MRLGTRYADRPSLGVARAITPQDAALITTRLNTYLSLVAVVLSALSKCPCVYRNYTGTTYCMQWDPVENLHRPEQVGSRKYFIKT